MRSLRKAESAILLSLVAITLGLTDPVSSALSQTPTSSQPASSQPIKPQAVSSPQQSPSPDTTTACVRRAAPGSSDPKPGESQPTSTTAETRSISKEKPLPKSEIATLRDEITGATNEQARARLQLKLVDQLVSAGLKQEAIAELETMAQQERFDPQGFYNIANAQARLGESDGAVKSYRKAIEQRKGHHSRASNNLGVVLLRKGHWDEAFEAFMSALRQESFRYAEASYNLGRLYALRGENDLAVREWRRAVTVDPGHEAAAEELLRTGNAGNIVVASRATRSAANTPARRTAAPPETVRPISSVAAGKSPRVASRPLPAYTVDPETYDLLKRGRTARDRGRNDEAVENYRQVLARMGGYFPPANLELSYALIALKRTDEAIDTLLPVTLKDGTQIPISYYHLGRLYELRGELKLAEDHYSRAAEAYGESNNQFILDVGRVREKQGNLAGALTSLEQYITSMERQAQKPEWSDERLTALRLKLAASQPKQ